MSAFTADQYIGGQFTWFMGVVEDRNDPEQMGRVRVRCFGFHTDSRSSIKTDDLPWATVMMPSTASGVSGVGASHHGLVEGSWVVGFFRDGPSAQDPIVMGSVQGAPTASANASKGFNDPNGTYPRYTGEPDVNKRARAINTTPRKSIKAAGGKANIQEPDDQFAATYPRNHAYESESGHILEFDDTIGMERINIEHKSGSFIELHRNGDIRIRSLATKYESAVAWNLFIEKDVNIVVGGNLYASVGGETDIQCDNNINLTSAKDINIEAVGDVNINGFNVKIDSDHTNGRIDFNYEPVVQDELDLTKFVYGEPVFASPGGGGTAGAAPGGEYVGAATTFATQLSADKLPVTPYQCRKELGYVSEKYESNGKPGALGWDTTGGASYGAYQIATKTGTMKNFMSFIKLRGYNYMYEKLSSAGTPYADSRKAMDDLPFAKMWVWLAANDPDFKNAQHAFIQATHYDICANVIKSRTGIDINNGKYTAGVQNAVWSIAVQHGPSTSLINCLKGLDGQPEENLVNALYDERDNVDKWFKRSTPEVKASVAKRFAKERRDCLKAIEKLEGFTPNLPSKITEEPPIQDKTVESAPIIYDTKAVQPTPQRLEEADIAVEKAKAELPSKIEEAKAELEKNDKIPPEVKKQFAGGFDDLLTELKSGNFESAPFMGGAESLGKEFDLSNLRDIGAKINKGVVKLQDPNAAPYTGDDPIIRARLGLPPKEDTVTPTDAEALETEAEVKASPVPSTSAKQPAAAVIPPSADQTAIGKALNKVLDARIAMDQETPGRNAWYAKMEAYNKAKAEYELLKYGSQ